MSSLIFEQNIRAMEKRYPDVLQYLEMSDQGYDYQEEDDLTVGVQMVGEKRVMCALKNGRTYQLDSLYDSDIICDVWFDALGKKWDLGAKMLMYGLGNGMYVRKYLQSTRKDCSIVIHEPSAKMLRTALEYFDLKWLFEDNRVRFVFWPIYRGKEELKLFYEQIIEYKDIDSYRVTFYTNYPRLFEDDCSEYVTGIRSTRDLAIANQVVHDRFGDDYNRNTFANISYIPDSLSYEDLIRKMPDDIPAIVVAAGPSLDKNINDLKEAKGKCIIIATDTALKPLALAGIEPDLSAIMDGKKDARYLSEESSKRVPMFCTPRSGDEFMRLHVGSKFFTDNFCNHIKKFMDDEKCMFVPLSTGGSVANSCFGLAESLHCRRIILVGQDLAYTGDKTHSKVTVRGEKATAVEDLEHVMMGVDINGEPVRTSREFKLYKEWFEDEIKMHPNLRVIDATEGGIRIEGTELMSLREAIERECTKEFDFQSVLSGVGRLLSGDKRQRFVQYIRKIPDQLEELRSMISLSLADYSGMRKLVKTDKYRTSEFARLYSESRDIAEKIENSPVIEYVHNQLQERSSQMLDQVNRLEDDEKSELLAVCDLGEKYLKDMLESMRELDEYVENMMIRLDNDVK